MQHEKLTEVLVSCFYADDDTVVIGDISDEIWHSTKKNMKESNRDCKSYGTIDLSFKIASG